MSGVEARGKSVRIYFQYKGERCRETLPGGNNPANVAQAKRMVEIIEYEIQTGTFDYARHFPNSAKLVDKRPNGGTVTMANHFAAWKKAGLPLGSHDYQVLATEGWGNAGGNSKYTITT